MRRTDARLWKPARELVGLESSTVEVSGGACPKLHEVNYAIFGGEVPKVET